VDTVHNYEQIMAWQPSDVRALIGSHVSPRAAADDRTFWMDPHGYIGEWEPLASGLVMDTEYTLDSAGYSGRLLYADGGWCGWISGQPIFIIEMTGS
jgi:hypothetical protein